MSQPADTPRSACPPWCRRDHAASPHPEDRRHRGEPAIVPAILAIIDDETLAARPIATELVVQRFQDDPADPIWIQVAATDTAATLVLRLTDVPAFREALAAA